jgi:CRP/FNR family cyclic AMP-dependent transcriptional regulator
MESDRRRAGPPAKAFPHADTMNRSSDASALIDALPAPLQALARRGSLRRYRRGSVLIEEGEAGDTLLIVLSGRVRAYSADARGREITYGLYGAGEYLGEMSLDGGLRSASVSATEASLCAIVTRATLLAHIAEHPEFALELIGKLIRRARAATLSAKQLALNDVYGRLVLLLESLAEPVPGQGHVLRERLTHREMAQRVGSSREMVSKLLKDLAAGGHVTPAPDGRLAVRLPLPSKW